MEKISLKLCTCLWYRSGTTMCTPIEREKMNQTAHKRICLAKVTTEAIIAQPKWQEMGAMITHQMWQGRVHMMVYKGGVGSNTDGDGACDKGS